MARIDGPIFEEGLYGIWDCRPGRGWWRANSNGYSIWPSAAGMYTAPEVNRITGRTERNPRGSTEDFWVFPMRDLEAEVDRLFNAMMRAAKRLVEG